VSVGLARKLPRALLAAFVDADLPAPSGSNTALRNWWMTGFSLLVAMSSTPSLALLGLYW
jgi:hypothetical protein